MRNSFTLTLSLAVLFSLTATAAEHTHHGALTRASEGRMQKVKRDYPSYVTITPAKPLYDPVEARKPRRVGDIVNAKYAHGPIKYLQGFFCGYTKCEEGFRRCNPKNPSQCIRECGGAYPMDDFGTWCLPGNDNCCGYVKKIWIGARREAQGDAEHPRCGRTKIAETDWCHPFLDKGVMPCHSAADKLLGAGVWCSIEDPFDCCVNL